MLPPSENAPRFEHECTHFFNARFLPQASLQRLAIGSPQLLHPLVLLSLSRLSFNDTKPTQQKSRHTVQPWPPPTAGTPVRYLVYHTNRLCQKKKGLNCCHRPLAPQPSNFQYHARFWSAPCTIMRRVDNTKQSGWTPTHPPTHPSTQTTQPAH